MDFGNEKDIVDEDCDMSGSVLFQTNVDDVVACQELLQVFGPKYGAKVFSFSNFDGLCSLLDNQERVCDARSGQNKNNVKQQCLVSTVNMIQSAASHAAGTRLTGRCRNHPVC